MDHMNDCSAFSETVFLYAEEKLRREDGGGAGEIKNKAESENGKFADFEKHLAECEACRKELSECEQMLYAAKRSESEFPEELHGEIMSRIKCEAKIAKRKRAYRFLGGMAAALVIAVGAYTALRMPGLYKTSNDAAVNVECDAIFDALNGEAFMDKSFDENDATVPPSASDPDQESSQETEEKKDLGADIVYGDEDRESGENDCTDDVFHEVPDSEIEDILLKAVALSEYSGGVAYRFYGDGAKSAFDALTNVYETVPYSFDGYCVLLFDIDMQDALDGKICALLDKYGANAENFKFGSSCDCVAIIVER